MWHNELFRLLWRSVVATPSLISGNWFGVFYAIFVFLAVEGITFKVRGWGKMKERLKESLAIGVGAVVLSWTGLILVSVVVAVYHNHNDEVGRWRAVVNEKNALKHDLSVSSLLINQFQNKSCPPLVSSNKPAMNTKPTHPPLPLATVHIAYQKQIASADADLPYGLETLITTDKDITPMALNLIFSGEIGRFQASQPYGSYEEQQGGVLVKSPNIVFLQRKTPDFTVDAPLKVVVYSKAMLTLQKIVSVPFNFPAPAESLRN